MLRGKNLVNVRALRKAIFYKINEEFRRADLVLKQTSSSVLICRRFPTKWYPHGTSNHQYIKDEDELQENELEDY